MSRLSQRPTLSDHLVCVTCWKVQINSAWFCIGFKAGWINWITGNQGYGYLGALTCWVSAYRPLWQRVRCGWSTSRFIAHQESMSAHILALIFLLVVLKRRGIQLYSWRALVFKPAPGDPLSSSNPNQTHLNQLIFRITWKVTVQVGWSRLERTFAGQWIPRSRVKDLCCWVQLQHNQSRSGLLDVYRLVCWNGLESARR